MTLCLHTFKCADLMSRLPSPGSCTQPGWSWLALRSPIIIAVPHFVAGMSVFSGANVALIIFYSQYLGPFDVMADGAALARAYLSRQVDREKSGRLRHIDITPLQTLGYTCDVYHVCSRKKQAMLEHTARHSPFGRDKPDVAYPQI